MSQTEAVVLERSSGRKRLTVTLTIEHLVIGTLLILLVGVVFATIRADAVQKAADGTICHYCDKLICAGKQVGPYHAACERRLWSGQLSARTEPPAWEHPPEVKNNGAIRSSASTAGVDGHPVRTHVQ